LIVSLSPETIPFHDGHAPLGRYSLTYEIDGAEIAKKAYISIDARGVGVLQQFDVDLQPRGKIEFFLDASNIDLGPTVRFRAHCPGNDTDWFLMGSDPLPYPEMTTSSQIGSVLPAYVETSQRPLGGNFPVTIKGAKITKDCTAEAQIDGNTVELKNAVASYQQISGQLAYSDLQGRPISTRHMDVNLVVNGPGTPAEDTYILNFVE